MKKVTFKRELIDNALRNKEYHTCAFLLNDIWIRFVNSAGDYGDEELYNDYIKEMPLEGVKIMYNTSKDKVQKDKLKDLMEFLIEQRFPSYDIGDE